jgi:hypothetical protein
MCRKFHENCIVKANIFATISISVKQNFAELSLFADMKKGIFVAALTVMTSALSFHFFGA